MRSERSQAMAKEIARLILSITGDQARIVQSTFGLYPLWRVFRIDPSGKEYQV